MKKPLEVTITVGTSFSIGGAFTNPGHVRPVGERTVYCDGHGLDFMLDTMNKHNISSSFFIETANQNYFGDGPMGRIVDEIKKAGQDRQLLVHPCWFNYSEDGGYSKNDSCAERPYDELKKILTTAQETFERWNGEKPQVIRAGNCMIDKQFYEVVSEIGIPLSSSLGLGIFVPNGKKFLIYRGRQKYNDVMEVPLFTYKDKDLMGGFPNKTLEITSCSKSEMRFILKKARQVGVKNIVLLTQPFDYVKKRDDQYKEITANRVNKERLEDLCSFIAEHDQDFTSVDFSSKAEEWKEVELQTVKRFRIPTRYRNGRKIENFINDKFWNY